jgi:ATP-binding cassette subfamily F protein 1
LIDRLALTPARPQAFQKEQERRSREGAQFSCSQTAVDPNDPQWQNSLDVTIPSFTISAYNKNLFVNASLTISHGRHYGLVGPNGKGKSTLLKMIASGDLQIPPRVDCLYVEQEVQADSTRAIDAVLRADKERWALIQEEKQLIAQLAQNHDDELDARLGQVYEEVCRATDLSRGASLIGPWITQLAAMDASKAEPKARRILFGLGFDTEMQNRPTKEFSGGWRMRISLARALFIEPTLLMLGLFQSLCTARVGAHCLRLSASPCQTSPRTTWT